MKTHRHFWKIWFSIYCIIAGFFFFVDGICFLLCDSPQCNHNFFPTRVSAQICFVATVIAYIIHHFVDYITLNKIDDYSIRMKFKNFKDAYYVNANRWKLNNGKLVYYGRTNGFYTKSYHVTFSYFDWLKFILWDKIDDHNQRTKRKREKQEQHNVRMAEMLKYIQMDINEAYDKIKEMNIQANE